MKRTDMKIVSAEPFMVEVEARAPLKFGAVVVDSGTIGFVRVTAENRAGDRAEGWGAMFIMDMWAWPSRRIPHEKRLPVMKSFFREICRKAGEMKEAGHPVELFHLLENDFRPLAKEVSRRAGLEEEMPYLAQLVAASPLDAAMHDAFGHLLGKPVFECYGPDFMNHDLSRYLGGEFRGRYISDYVSVSMPDRIPAFHLVGGMDKLRESELSAEDPRDGLPVSLDQWIRFERLRRLKVKLKGTDLDWDLDRLDEVASTAYEEHRKLGLSDLKFSADTNEQCEGPEYIVELLAKLKERNPRAEADLLYIEQPTARDLRAERRDMRRLAAMKPVIIDESLMTLEDFDLAMELGWSGIALKACKCHSAALVFASKAEQMGIPYTVQDLTNPSIALIQSVVLAGHLKNLWAFECNSRQFFPAANEPESKVHPGVFRLKDGAVRTESIRGPGFGFRWDEIGRDLGKAPKSLSE